MKLSVTLSRSANRFNDWSCYQRGFFFGTTSKKALMRPLNEVEFINRIPSASFSKPSFFRRIINFLYEKL